MIHDKDAQEGDPKTQIPELRHSTANKELSGDMFDVLDVARKMLGDRLRQPFETLGSLGEKVKAENKQLDELSDAVDIMYSRVQELGALQPYDIDEITRLSTPLLKDLSADANTLSEVTIGAAAGRDMSEMAAQEIDGLGRKHLSDTTEHDEKTEEHTSALVESRRLLMEAASHLAEIAVDNDNGVHRGFNRAQAQLEGEIDEVGQWAAKMRTGDIEHDQAMLMISKAVDRAKDQARLRNVSFESVAANLLGALDNANQTKVAHGHFEAHK